MKNIPFNIWDDYSENEDTYGYIEEYSELSESEKLEIYHIIQHVIKSVDGDILFREFHSFYSEEQIVFQNLFHSTRDHLVKTLNSLKLVYKNLPIVFYSES
jgi:hypothetical protein